MNRCIAWLYPGHESWDGKLSMPDGKQCRFQKGHRGPHLTVDGRGFGETTLDVRDVIDGLNNEIGDLTKERDDLRDVLIGLCDLQITRRGVALEVRAIRKAANHLAEPFSHDKVLRSFLELLNSEERGLVEEIATALEGPGQQVGINAHAFAKWLRSEAWRRHG